MSEIKLRKPKPVTAALLGTIYKGGVPSSEDITLAAGEWVPENPAPYTKPEGGALEFTVPAFAHTPAMPRVSAPPTKAETYAAIAATVDHLRGQEAWICITVRREEEHAKFVDAWLAAATNNNRIADYLYNSALVRNDSVAPGADEYVYAHVQFAWQGWLACLAAHNVEVPA